MSYVKYPEQVEKLKEMRRCIGISAFQASQIVRTDLRNWQKWEAGELKVPESAIELFCIKNNLEYSVFATPLTDAQSSRNLKREQKFQEYKARHKDE